MRLNLRELELQGRQEGGGKMGLQGLAQGNRCRCGVGGWGVRGWVRWVGGWWCNVPPVELREPQQRRPGRLLLQRHVCGPAGAHTAPPQGPEQPRLRPARLPAWGCALPTSV